MTASTAFLAAIATVLYALAGLAAIVALITAVLWTESRAIDRACERFDLTDDDAPRDDNDYAPDPYVVRRRLNGDH